MAAPLAERRSGGRAGNNLFNRIGYPQGSLTVPDTHEQVGRSGWLRHVLVGSTLWSDIRLRGERKPPWRNDRPRISRLASEPTMTDWLECEPQTVSAAEPTKRLTIDIPLVMHTTVAVVVLLAFWFWP